MIFGDGSITRDFFFVKDTAKVLSSLIGNIALKGNTYNLGTGVEISMKKLVETILNLIPEKQIPIKYMEDRPADVPRLWVDASKIRNRVNIENECDFENGILESINYYKELNKISKLSEKIKLINWEK